MQGLNAVRLKDSGSELQLTALVLDDVVETELGSVIELKPNSENVLTMALERRLEQMLQQIQQNLKGRR